MKKVLLLIPIVGILGMIQFSFKPAAESYKIDLNKSSLGWTGYKVSGKHMGALKLKSGELKFDGAKLIGGSFEIDMNSMSSTDLSGEYADKLLGHLKSDDFFGTSMYPTAKLVITKVIPQGPNFFKLTADITIKNITKSIRFSSVVKDENGVKTANSEIKIDRGDFNVKYGSGTFFENLGDKTILDEFDMSVKIVAMK